MCNGVNVYGVEVSLKGVYVIVRILTQLGNGAYTDAYHTTLNG